MKLQFSQSFSKNTKISNFVVIGPMGADILRRTEGRKTDGQSNIVDLKVTFRSFVHELAIDGY